MLAYSLVLILFQFSQVVNAFLGMNRMPSMIMKQSDLSHPRTNVIKRNLLDLGVFKFPLQSNPLTYENKLKEVLDETKIIRWYIAEVNPTTALVEVVYEKS